ncbi:MAG: PspC domain-containing protein [Candidatus Marinimicrobia bacterium]|nr:PspC domain-containing protein [Candidatus Neomarinimicrobiota bacterium]
MDRPGKQRLYRSRSDRKLLGVCGGLADYFQIDSTLIRVLWVAGSFLYGIGVLLYIVLVLALPDQPAVETTVSKKAKG